MRRLCPFIGHCSIGGAYHEKGTDVIELDDGVYRCIALEKVYGDLAVEPEMPTRKEVLPGENEGMLRLARLSQEAIRDRIGKESLCPWIETLNNQTRILRNQDKILKALGVKVTE